jgi:hypothetical protein
MDSVVVVVQAAAQVAVAQAQLAQQQQQTKNHKTCLSLARYNSRLATHPLFWHNPYAR